MPAVAAKPDDLIMTNVTQEAVRTAGTVRHGGINGDFYGDNRFKKRSKSQENNRV